MTSLQLVASSDTIKHIFLLGLLAFVVSMVLTPVYTMAAFKGKWWKKPKTEAITGEKAKIFQKLHAAKHERHIPTMAGIIILASVAIVTLTSNLSRSQTYLSLGGLIGAGLIGLLDDIANVRGLNIGKTGIKAKTKTVMLIAIALVGGWWFYSKLGVSSIHIPHYGELHLGWLIIPLFVFVVNATANAVNITDGLDGLAGGLTAMAFGAYAIIALFGQQYGVAAFCMTIVGAMLSYTWFNVFPARFFMGDSGSFALGTALGIVALQTNTLYLLPVIGFVFLVELASSFLQIASKKLRNGKKIFKIAPIHHHFEAIGWPETKVTMRFWIIGQMCAFVGVILFILGGK